MLHWRHHARTSLARSATTVTSKVNVRAHLHSSACTQGSHSLKGLPISVRSRQVHLATTVGPSICSHHTLRGRVAASTNQSGPPDWCLLRLDHVEYGWLHVDGLTLWRQECYLVPMQSVHSTWFGCRKWQSVRGPLIGASCKLTTLGVLAACRWDSICGQVDLSQPYRDGKALEWMPSPCTFAEECRWALKFTLDVTVVALLARLVRPWCLQCNMSRLNSD